MLHSLILLEEFLAMEAAVAKKKSSPVREVVGSRKSSKAKDANPFSFKNIVKGDSNEVNRIGSRIVA